MTGLGRLLGLLVLLGLQGALAPHLAIAGVRPDLPLVAVLVIALFGGPVRGGGSGLAAGFALDLLRGTRLGLFALATGAAGWLCGEAAGRIDAGRGAVRWVLASGSAFLYGLIVVGVAVVLDRNGIHATGALRHLLLATLYDGTLAAIVYGVVALIRHNPLPMGTRPLSGWRQPLGSRHRAR